MPNISQQTKSGKRASNRAARQSAGLGKNALKLLAFIAQEQHHFAGWYPSNVHPADATHFVLRGHNARIRVPAVDAREALAHARPAKDLHKGAKTMFCLTTKGKRLLEAAVLAGDLPARAA